MIWCGSTEIFLKPHAVHETPESFVAAMKENHPAIAPSMLYAWAAITSGVPFANGAPNLTVDIPAIVALAKQHAVPICGKDFKTGQTLMKTILAPGFKARLLGMNGWFSTNILGNRDGEVLDDPESPLRPRKNRTPASSKIYTSAQAVSRFVRKDSTTKSESFTILRAATTKRDGGNSLSTSSAGWAIPMQIKVDFLCRDSILAAPIVLDLILFLDLAKRAGMRGIQEWLSFYFKSPMCAPELYPEHDLFIQSMKLKNTLRWMMGEDLITHLGQEYYD